MKKSLLATALLVLSTACIAAPPSERSVEELLAVTKSEQLLKGALAQVDGTMRSAFDAGIDAQNLNPEEKEKATRLFVSLEPKLHQIMSEFLTWDH
ncbi:hypothetical protein [Chitiniphilus eburneus]|uniref:hypothetical protein n=1 Tax=Chitiniphilus eburneus TaxID=2571148 RepID=UPI001FE397BC|nr:hypothetical protein [Chitiniphilus eburneus]